MKIYYTLDDDDNVQLNKIVETHVVYEDVVESLEQTGDNFALEGSSDDANNLSSADSEAASEAINEATDATVINGDQLAEDVTVEDTVILNEVTNAEVAIEPKVSAVSENESEQEGTSAASFANSERAELEALRKEKKITLINSYSETLPEEVRENFVSQVDNFTFEQLETELLKAYKDNAENYSATPVPFAVPEPVKKQTAEDNLNSYIRRMLGR